MMETQRSKEVAKKKDEAKGKTVAKSFQEGNGLKKS